MCKTNISVGFSEKSCIFFILSSFLLPLFLPLSLPSLFGIKRANKEKIR